MITIAELPSNKCLTKRYFFTAAGYFAGMWDKYNFLTLAFYWMALYYIVSWNYSAAFRRETLTPLPSYSGNISSP